MKRLVGSVVLVAALAASARAHFLFMVPGDGSVTVVFSDSLEPDKAKYIKKVGHTKYHVVGEKGELTAVAQAKVKAVDGKGGVGHIEVKLAGKPAGGAVVGSCPYGVFGKGEKTFFLNYYARAAFTEAGRKAELPSKAQPLQALVTEVKGGKATVKVLWQGKPLKDAEVALTGEKTEPVHTDEAGTATLSLADARAGTKVGVRARHVENKPGEHDGTKYAEVRHYSTTVFSVPGGK